MSVFSFCIINWIRSTMLSVKKGKIEIWFFFGCYINQMSDSVRYLYYKYFSRLSAGQATKEYIFMYEVVLIYRLIYKIEFWLLIYKILFFRAFIRWSVGKATKDKILLAYLFSRLLNLISLSAHDSLSSILFLFIIINYTLYLSFFM